MSTGTQRVQLMSDSIVEREIFESEKVGSFERDTTYVMDSVRIETRNDTVYHTRWRTEYRDRVVERRDTVRLSHSALAVSHSEKDTQTETKVHVERRGLSWYWKLLIWNVVIVVMIVVFYLLRKQLLR